MSHLIHSKIKFLLLGFLFLCWINNIQAQTVYSLQQLIDKTLTGNLNIQKSINQGVLTNFEIDRVKSTYLPTLNANGTHQFNFGRSIDRTTNQFTTQTLQNTYLSLSADMPIFSGFEKYYLIKYSKLNAKSQESSIQNAKNETILNLVNQYLQVILLKQKLIQIETQLESSVQQQKKILIQFNAGALNQSKKLEAENQVATDNSSLIDIQNQISNALIQIKQTANLNITEKFDVLPINIDNITENFSDADLNSVLETGIKNLPAYQQAELSLMAAGYQISQAKSGLFPRISLSGSISSTYSSAFKNTSIELGELQQIGFVQNSNTPVLTQGFRYVTSDAGFGEQLKNNFGQNLGVNLSIPIFNGLSVKQNIKQAQIQEKTAQYSFREAEQKAKIDVYTAYQNILNDRKKVAAAEIKLNSNKELFRQAEINYNAGGISVFDFTQAKSQLNIAQNEYLVSKFQYIFDIKVFEYYSGKPIQF